MKYVPYQQRHAIRFQPPRTLPAYPDYNSAINTARVARWWPLYRLLEARFRGGKGFSDYEIARLVELKEEYEGGMGGGG